MSPETRATPSFNRAALHRWLGVGMGALVVCLLWGGSRLLRQGPRLSTRAAPATEPVRSLPAAHATPAVAELPRPAPPAPDVAIAPMVAPAVSPPRGPCPAEMALVEGDYCTAVAHDCKEWLDDDLLPYARCARYEPPARCTGKHVRLHFCIDRREYTPVDQKLPQNYASFNVASKVCAGLGKRVCTESEWNFACEGPEMLPYPYGWTREPVCNQDRTDLYELNPKRQVLKDWRQASGEASSCQSPFGVYDMTGNMDEPVLREAQRYDYPFRNALKGGWWMAGRNRCRPATTAHNDHYRDIQIGIRCCQDLAD